MAIYKIYVSNREGIFDPAGSAATKALGKMGFEDVASVSIGRYIEVETNAGLEAVEEMANKLLVNPVMEDFIIEAPDAGKGA